MLNEHGEPKASAPHPCRLRAVGRASIAGLAGFLLLAGCTSSTSQTASIFGGLIGGPVAEGPDPASPALAPPPPLEPKVREAERSGCASAAECKLMLKTMIDSPDRGWIGQRQSPDVYANGTRLFAYRALRRRLTCGELTQAVDELQAVSKSLSAPVSSMSADQQSRTRTLCTQVEAELAKEREGRCRT